MDHDLTIPLTVPVDPAEAFLLDQLRGPTGLPVGEQRKIIALVENWVTELLGALPAGTPESLIDDVCELIESTKSHVGSLQKNNLSLES